MKQGWFSMSGSNGREDLQKQQSGSSLLADWNSYAASRDSEDGSGSFGFDIESAVRSANETVTGTFSVVSKGVRDIPGSLQSATSSVPSGKALMYFGLFLATGVFFIFIAFTMFLPVMVLMPQKFAISFTLGCGFIVGSFVALKGPKNQLTHMTSKEEILASFRSAFAFAAFLFAVRKSYAFDWVVAFTFGLAFPFALALTIMFDSRLPSTLGFIGTMVGTIYVSMVLHSYILSVLFSVLQVLALAYYCISYFPGGSAGLKFLASALSSSVLRCFGR